MTKDKEEAHKSIIKWLKEEGAFKEELDSKGLHFNIAAEYKPGSGRLVNIFQSEKSTDKVTIASGMNLAEGMKETFKGLKKTAREALTNDLRYSLVRMPGNFEFQMEGTDLTGIRFSNSIYYDGLTKNRLYMELEHNWKKFLFSTWKLQEHL